MVCSSLLGAVGFLAEAKQAGVEVPQQLSVIAFNDRCAVGLMFELRRAGLAVPRDMSIVGYDDVSMAALPFIDLTTVGQDVLATARIIAKCSSQYRIQAPKISDWNLADRSTSGTRILIPRPRGMPRP